MAPGDALRLLLVEDDDGDATLLRSSLAPATDVTRARTLSEAGAAVRADDVDVVLLDLGLPDSEGLATLQGLLDHEPTAPVVVLTNLDDDRLAAEAVAAGAQDLVVKGSVSQAVLQRVLRHAVERHRLQQEAATASEDARRAEQRLRATVAQLPGILWTTDGQLRLTWLAGAELAAQGLRADQLTGTPAGSLEARGGPPVEVEVLRAALEGTPGAYEVSWRGRRWRTLVQPSTSHDGVLELVCVSLDVTERVAQRHALDQARERLQGLFDNALEAIMLADDDGRFVDVNPAACTLTGRDREDLLGVRVTDVMLVERPDDDPATMWTTFLERGSMQGDVQLEHASGRRLHAEFRAVADIVPGVHLSVLRDATERRRAERALAASERRFRTLAESAHDVIYRLRAIPTFEVTYMNGSIERVTGYPVERYLQDAWFFLSRVRDEHRPRLLFDPEEVTTSATVLFEFRREDGDWVWLEDNRVPIVEDGGVVGLQGILRDVTERERTTSSLRAALQAEREAAERLRDADRVKAHFLQALSHELRTPLTAMRGLTATLLEHPDRLGDDLRREMLARVAANTERLEGLIDDLLDLDRLEQGEVPMAPGPTDVTALALEVVQDVEHDEHVLEAEAVRSQTGQPVLGVVDPSMVRRILLSLLTNAIRHTPPGTTIRLACTREDTGVLLTVADEGPGIPEHLADDVFDPFRQGPGVVDAAQPGTGVGLSIVRQFAALHGGQAWVEETPGGGATFRVRLPDVRPDAPPAPHAPAREPATDH